MFGSRIPRFRILASIAMLLILSAAAYGFAAANTVPVSSAGDGAGTITGYTVGAVTYALNATTPSDIDSVSFTLTPVAPATSAPTTVKAKLVSSSSTYSTCTVTGTVWKCSFTGVSATAANELRVIAAQ